MADIRINALATTAASTASDDFLAVDGSSQGTRKLNAFSPTFGGNITSSNVGFGFSQAASNGANGPVGATFQNTSSGGYTLFRAIGNTSASYNMDVGVGGSAVGGSLQNYGFTWTNNGLSGYRIVTNGGTLAATFDNSANTTLAGNLTVSGTGNNIFNSGGGNLLIGTTTDIGGASGGVSAKTLRLSINSTNTNYADFGPVGSAGTTADYTKLQGWSDTAVAARNLALNPTGANVLIGTTTDSGNGKLQLATHTTSAGGIGFGTDTALYRSAAYTLKLDGGNNVTSFRVLGSGSCEALMAVTSASSVLFGSTTAGASTVLCSGNGTTALTLDSSQTANFSRGASPTYQTSNTVRVNGGATGALEVNANNGTGLIQFASGSTYQGNFLTTDAGATLRLTAGTGMALLLCAADSSTKGIKIDTSGNLIAALTGTAPSLGTNSTMTFELTSNTSLTIKVRGTDGTTRSVALTLA